MHAAWGEGKKVISCKSMIMFRLTGLTLVAMFVRKQM